MEKLSIELYLNKLTYFTINVDMLISIKINERYNRTVRYDWLSQYLFESIAEVQLHATQWLWTYNNERPNTAIGGIPPRQKLALVA